MVAITRQAAEAIRARRRRQDHFSLLQAIRAAMRNWQSTRDLAPSIRKVRPYTMLSPNRLVSLGVLVRYVLAEGIPGSLVECGVWRGGASFLMADLVRRAGVQGRKVWMFDSFEGLPPPAEIDGARARMFAELGPCEDTFYNCSASLEEVQRNAARLGLSDLTECVKGWFDQTLPTARTAVGQIALLRIDGDWYSSVRCCLDNLYDQVTEGGFIIIDDYYDFDGCAIAVHEFLGERRLAHRMMTVTSEAGANECIILRKDTNQLHWPHWLPLELIRAKSISKR